MARKRTLVEATEEFDAHYESIFGSRWDSLRTALLNDKRKWPLAMALENLLLSRKVGGLADPPVSEVPGAYLLDPASLIPPILLEPKRDEKILDLCAAPGGKSLAILALAPDLEQLVLNEKSPDRSYRLKSVIRAYAKASPAQLRFSQHDGVRWGLYEQNTYDRVLIDAPCSGERHLLQSQKDLIAWSPKRHQRLAVQQVALLCAGLEALKPGGRMVYSTCSLSNVENDQVIERFLRKRTGRVKVEPVHWEDGELTEFGRLFIPDRCGYGPIFVSVLSKLGT